MTAHLDLSHITNFWNSAPANGAFHKLICEHRWSLRQINALDRQGIALLGESIAAKWAEIGFWRILERQKRHRGFELDLVIQKNQSLRIIEVKTRLYPDTPPDMVLTEAWLNQKKRSALKRGAQFVLHSMGSAANHLNSITCDLVAIDVLKNQSIAVYRWPDVFSLA
jgi:Holliday junction resolvase-like predicted endonuclease